MSSRLVKKSLTLAQAEEQWVASHLEGRRQKALNEEAAEILHKHFDRTGRASYKRVGRSELSRQVLDQSKVRAFLGERLADFQKRVVARSLSLLR